jgi:GntR family transcriptional regulator
MFFQGTDENSMPQGVLRNDQIDSSKIDGSSLDFKKCKRYGRPYYHKISGIVMEPKAIAPRSVIPLFVQVASAMRRRIEFGMWPEGERIPSLDNLAKEFVVARTTARQAVSQLEGEGLVWRKQGKGTFVANTWKKDRHWLNLQTKWDDLIQFIKGTTTTLLTLNMEAKLPSLPMEEGVSCAEYVYMKRLHKKDEQAYCVIDLYLDASLYRKKQEVFDQKTILSELDSMSEVSIRRAHQILTIGTADIDNAGLLGVSLDAPVAYVRRIITSERNDIIYLGDVVYRADVVKLDIDLR